VIRNIALRRLILIAYGIQDYQLWGDPSWIRSEHYDIQAKADGNTSVQQLEGAMLQALLKERFKLTLHRETRELPVYALTVGKGAAKLHHTEHGACTPYSLDSPPPILTQADPHPIFCGLHLTVEGLNRTLDGKGVTMDMLAANLSRTYNSSLGRNVIDRSGLAGAFDVHLTWAIDPLAAVSDAGATSPEGTGPALVTALREQLGLKLESAKGPVEGFVVDHVERPSAN